MNTLKTNKGFTLAELLVTVAIFSVISAVVLANYPRFTVQAALTNLTYDVALVVREAQVFGIAVRELGTGSGIFPTRGVHFGKNQKDRFELFVDTTPEDGKYSDPVELVEEFFLRSGHEYGTLCGYANVGSSCQTLDSLHITFDRPSPEANLIGIHKVSGSDVESQYSYASIDLTAPTGELRTVTVWSSGQISVGQ